MSISKVQPLDLLAQEHFLKPTDQLTWQESRAQRACDTTPGQFLAAHAALDHPARQGTRERRDCRRCMNTTGNEADA